MANPEDLEAFEKWLREYGRDHKTVKNYLCQVSKASESGGFLVRVTDRNLAPKTRHLIRAVGRQWALFTSDDDLLSDLRKVRLPPAQRKAIKEPLDRETWFALCDEIDSADDLSDPVRASLGIMATRGLRCGDVLRLTRAEVRKAAKTDLLAFEGKLGKRHEFDVMDAYKGYIEILNSSGKYDRVWDLISPGAEDPEKAAYMKCLRGLGICSERIGIEKVTTHILRHTVARQFLRQLEGDPEAITKLQNWMQWSKIETAAQYVGYHRREALSGTADAMMRRKE